MKKVYLTKSSIIEYDPAKSLLYTTWLKDSATLTEPLVMSEIKKVLDFSRELKIKHIIIDAREYTFRENYNIQNWINFTFMPAIVDCGVKKYAIIVTTKIEDRYKGFDDAEKDMLQVEYFTLPDEAQAWIGA